MVGVILSAVWKTTINKIKGLIMLAARDPSVGALLFGGFS